MGATSQAKNLFSFVVILGVIWGVLRVVNLVIPMAYPGVLQGPFSLDDPSDVEEYAGFSPLVPYYRPELLGQRPILVTARRRPPQVVIFWQGEHFLYLEEELDGDLPPIPEDAEPLLGDTNAVWWRDGSTVHAAATIERFAVELRTDLPPQEARRILDTLRSVAEIR